MPPARRKLLDRSTTRKEAVMRALVTAGLFVMLTLSARAPGVVVQGRVIDPAGSAIPGATVELVGAGKAIASTVSGTDGTFRFADVGAGSYEIRVTLNGSRQSRLAVTVGADSPAPFTIKLLVGSTAESVAVSGANPNDADWTKSARIARPQPAAAPEAAPAQPA